MNAEKKPPFEHTGSSFDSFLEEQGILDEVRETAMQRVMTWKVSNASKAVGR